MSAPLRLTPEELHRLADALIDAGNIRAKHGVRFDGQDTLKVTVNDDVTLQARWDDQDDGYVIDDRYGS